MSETSKSKSTQPRLRGDGSPCIIIIGRHVHLSLKKRNISLLSERKPNSPHLEPREHELLRREVGGAQLVVCDEGPDESQDQLQVAVVDVRVAWKRRINDQ